MEIPREVIVFMFLQTFSRSVKLGILRLRATVTFFSNSIHLKELGFERKFLCQTQINSLIGKLPIKFASFFNKKFVFNILNEVMVLVKIFKTSFILIKLIGGAKRKNKGIGMRKEGIVFDLTRQHLPPAISIHELHDFFFDNFRRVCSKKTEVIRVLSKNKEHYNQPEDIHNLYFSSTFISVLRSNLSAAKFFVSWAVYFPIILFVLVMKKSKDYQVRYIYTDLLEIFLFTNSGYSMLLEEAIVTNSSFYNQPAIFFIKKSSRSFQTIMIHYSENSFPITEEEYEQMGLPGWLKTTRADFHYVWTESYANFLKELIPNVKVLALGSLIFRKPSSSKCPLSGGNEFVVTIFDITPSIFENLYSAYTEQDCISFLNEIEIFKNYFGATERSQLKFQIKAKRRIISGQNRVYLQHRENMILNEVMVGVDWFVSLYDIILESNLVICAVGSSPALIADEFNIPVVYLYPGDRKLLENFLNRDIQILQNAKQLKEFQQRMAPLKKNINEI